MNPANLSPADGWTPPVLLNTCWDGIENYTLYLLLRISLMYDLYIIPLKQFLLILDEV